MPKIGDITNVWNTVRELNVGDIREEAEQRVSIIVIGEHDARTPIVRALRGRADRYPARSAPSQRETIAEYDLSLSRERQPDIQQGTLIILALDGAKTPSPDVERVADKLSLVPAPLVGVCVDAVRMPVMANGREPDLGPIPLIFVSSRSDEALADEFIPKLVEHLPEDYHLAAARQLPGLRDAVGRTLIADTSFSNATFALTSSLPELIPLLNLPLNAADMLVLTKNQALLVYKLGLAYGAPPDFQAQLREIMPVIGTGFLWRQMARQLIGIIPGFGLVPKVAVAYGGTFATGQAAALWYSKGEALSPARLNQLRKQAITEGVQWARERIGRRGDGEGTDLAPRRTRSSPLDRFRRLLPGGKETPPTDDTDDTKDT